MTKGKRKNKKRKEKEMRDREERKRDGVREIDGHNGKGGCSSGC